MLREGSLSAASRALDVAQPTVRRQIEALEEQLGVVLFVRASNGLVPTEIARAALPYVESIASTARALTRAVAGGASAERGTVRVTCSEIVGTEVLAPMLAAIRATRPALQFEVAATNRTEDLLRRDADIAVRMVEPTQAGLVRRRAGRVELGLFAHARYLEGRTPPRSLEQLVREHDVIGADRSPVIVETLARAGVSTTPRDFAIRSDSDAVQLAAVRAGLGVGVCQVPLARAPVPLVRVLPEVAFHLDLWLVMHEDLRASARVRAIFDALAESFARYAAPMAQADRASPPRARR